MRILFICKKNETYGFETYTRRSSGLYNSTRFIVEGLQKRGVHAHIIEVIDNNCIDKEVTKFKPDVVVIEALWVVPEKFHVLRKLHPHVKWFIHMHSHMPFLALEGVSMDWLPRYSHMGLGIIANSPESFDAFACVLSPESLVYLPNVYISQPRHAEFKDKHFIDIGCFGAVRPLKNQLLQAMCAIKFARSKGKLLRFHINGSRVETGGEPVLKSLQQLFEHQPDCELVMSKWHEPEDFLKILSHIDIGMQVSLTETFNVVCADYVTAGIPVVASKEVKWLSNFCKAQDDSPSDILRLMNRVWRNRLLIKRNQYLLCKFSEDAQHMWFNWLRDTYRG